jgi:hypothetical protein
MDTTDPDDSAPVVDTGHTSKSNQTTVRGYLLRGSSLSKLKQILDSQKPKCISCGRSIAGATVGRHYFCTTTADCRYASGAYKRYRKKGFSKEDSLEKVVMRLKEKRDGVLH